MSGTLFTGSSRRRREVNLSGRSTNPFAAQTSSDQVLANALQERQQRQRERERVNAAKRIQRIWRGHRDREAIAQSRRRAWDANQDILGTEAIASAQHTKLFVSFVDIHAENDLQRLQALCEGLLSADPIANWASHERSTILPPLAEKLLEALHQNFERIPLFLSALMHILQKKPTIILAICQHYYQFLSTLIIGERHGTEDDLLLAALTLPLNSQLAIPPPSKMSIEVYSEFAQHVLSLPELHTFLDLQALIKVIQPSILYSILGKNAMGQFVIGPNKQLWLLANIIAVHQMQDPKHQDQGYLTALASQLYNCSSEVIDRIDASDEAPLPQIAQSEERPNVTPLPTFVKHQLLSLINKESITSLLTHMNSSAATESEDASFFASYALTLLRLFPTQGDELRIWLYHGFLTVNGQKLTALAFFWHAVTSTNIFESILHDPGAALVMLRSSQHRDGQQIQSPERQDQDREWRLILLFLELYSFVLRFIDDEEFLGAHGNLSSTLKDTKLHSRASALPITDVKQLTIFLKNIVFTLHYHKAALTADVVPMSQKSIRNLFMSDSNRPQGNDSKAVEESIILRPFAGIAGMTLTYLTNITTSVMQMLYVRDSRRPFLPKDHWLMMGLFDMQGFIPAVVAEQEKQKLIGDGEEDSPVDEDELGNEGHDLLIGMARTQRARFLENAREHQQKLVRQRNMAAVAPRIQVLQHMPFVIPFETRVQIFHHFVLLDQTRRRGGETNPDHWRMMMLQRENPTQVPRRGGSLARYHAEIHRANIFEDALDQFWNLGDALKEPIQITFLDQFGGVEAGIDGGGVTKEFLTSITNEAFHEVREPALFSTNDHNLLYPNPSMLDQSKDILFSAGLDDKSDEYMHAMANISMRYQFLGRVIGKCLYEGILIDISFAPFFLLKWAAHGITSRDSTNRSNIDDLRDLDESLYQGLLKLKTYPGSVEDFSLDFTVTDTVSLPSQPMKTVTRELMPNGASVEVNNENRFLYMAYMARHRLQLQPRHQTQAFLRGLGEIIDPSWLAMFNQSELQTLIGGTASRIDLADLRAHTLYGGVYQVGDDGQDHPTIKIFWNVMQTLEDVDRRKVLKYVTSTPRAPLLGFAQLQPQFSIRDSGRDDSRLPSASTCINLLKLPMYSDEGRLKEKLLYAVNAGAGFDLS